MPLPVGTSTQIAPTRRPPAEKLGLTWAPPDGSLWDLTSRALSYWVRSGAVMFGGAPITITSDANPRGGARVRDKPRYEPRLITLPVHVKGKTHMEFLARWRALGDAFMQTTEYGKPGTLTVTRPDGSSRQISAWYQAGWDGQPDMTWLYDQPVLTLFCEDPWWLDTFDTVIPRRFTGTARSYFTGFPHISSSQTLGDTTVANPGQTEAWPVWTITGPASGITATIKNPDGSDGDSFTLTPPSPMVADDVVTIDTDGDGSVIGPDGSSWINTIGWPSSVLWSLPRGDSKVTFSVTGSGTGTSIQLAFKARNATA